MNDRPILLPPVEYYRSNKLCRDIVMEYQPGSGRPFDPGKFMAAFTRSFNHHYAFGEYMSRDQVSFMKGEAEVTSYFIRWWDAGRQMFVFPDSLIASFLETEVDDVPTSYLRCPYPHFYLKFGSYTDIAIPGIEGRFLDGAYVSEFDGGMRIDTTHFIPSAGTGASGRAFGLMIDDGCTVGEALDRGVASMRERQDEMEKEAKKHGDAYRHHLDTKAASLAIMESGIPLYRSCLRLVFNSLAFIHSHPDEIEDSFLDAPRPLVAKLERATTPKDVLRNTSKLMSAGFAKVRLCGRRISEELDHPGGIASEVRSHWRRGHWRHQPCGPKLSQLRLTWVRPTVVRADKGPPKLGHIYEPPSPPP